MGFSSIRSYQLHQNDEDHHQWNGQYPPDASPFLVVDSSHIVQVSIKKGEVNRIGVAVWATDLTHWFCARYSWSTRIWLPYGPKHIP